MEAHDLCASDNMRLSLNNLPRAALIKAPMEVKHPCRSSKSALQHSSLTR